MYHGSLSLLLLSKPETVLIIHFSSSITRIVWTIKQEYDADGAMQKITYPSTEPSGPFSNNATSFKVFYSLPPYMYLTQNDKIRVAAWDAKAGWIHDNIEDIKYDFDKKQLQFSTLRLAPYAFVQVGFEPNDIIITTNRNEQLISLMSAGSLDAQMMRNSSLIFKV